VVTAKVVVTTTVKDVQAWLEFEPPLIAELPGVASDGARYVAAHGRNRVATAWDVPDMEAFMSAQSRISPDVAAPSERAGMIPPVVIYVRKELDPQARVRPEPRCRLRLRGLVAIAVAWCYDQADINPGSQTHSNSPAT
jgi:hypothetical protein